MTSPTRSVATGTRCATTTEPLPISGAIESPTTTCRCRPKLIGMRATRVTGTQTMAPTTTRTHRGMGRRTGAVTISMHTPSPKAGKTWRKHFPRTDHARGWRPCVVPQRMHKSSTVR